MNVIKREDETYEEMVKRHQRLISKGEDRWVDAIMKGKFPLRAILNTQHQQIIERKLIEKYVDHTITKIGLISLIEHQLLSIRLTRRIIDDVADEIKPLIKRMIDAGVEVDFNTGLIDFDESLLENEEVK